MSDPIRTFTVYVDKKGAQEALDLLNRALNTLEPRDWPTWAAGMLKVLEEIIVDGDSDAEIEG